MNLNTVTKRLFILAIVSSLTACGGTQTKKPTGPVVVKPKVDPRAPGVPSPAIDAFETGVKALQAKPAKYTEALAAFKESVSIHDDYIVAWLNLAYTYEKLGRHKECAEAFRTLIRKDVTDRGVTLALGRARRCSLLGAGQVC